MSEKDSFTPCDLETDEIEKIAHGLRHYEGSHGNLPLFELPKYGCDGDDWGEPPENAPASPYRSIKVGYRDTANAFAELAKLRRAADLWATFYDDVTRAARDLMIEKRRL